MGTRVLVAEDNPDSLQLVSDILVSLGYTPVLATNGRHALEKLREYTPELILLDVNMPEMDGFAALEQIKNDPVTAKIPVIMLTAQSDVDSRVIGLQLGADDYLAKPFHARELIERIHTRLRAKSVTDDLRAQREQIRRVFERFVSHEIVETLLENPGSVSLGGAETIVTVLFADLEGFTPASEFTPPIQLLELLNRYHGLMVEQIRSNGGTIDKFLGDGVMALFNTPLQQPDHALRAVNAALDIHAALVDFYKELPDNFRMPVNFGIHTGRAVVGTVGTAEFMDFTAIGDTVNLASRLQGLSENGEIMISQPTYEAVRDSVQVEPLGAKSVRGRESEISVFRVTGSA